MIVIRNKKLTPEQIKEIQDRYANNGESLRKLASEYDVSRQTVCNYTSKLGIKKKSFFTEEEKDKIKEFYVNEGYNIEKISKELNINRSTIDYYVKRNNLTKNKTKIHNRRFVLNPLYFRNINNEKKAFLLGYIYMHSYGSKEHGLIIQVPKNDMAIALDFFNDLILNIRDYYDSIKDDNNRYVVLRISNKEILSDFENYGYFEGGRVTRPMPHLADNLMRHFVRGTLENKSFAIYKNKSTFKETVTITISSVNTNYLDLIVKDVNKYYNKELFKGISKLYSNGSRVIKLHNEEDGLHLFQYLYRHAKYFDLEKRNRLLFNLMGEDYEF